VTGPEHYREAERIMREMSIIEDGRTQEVALSEAMAAAQVHAILALAGATGVEARGADGQAWTEVAGVPRGRLPATTALGAGAVGGARWRAGNLGGMTLPPFGFLEVVSRWQFAPVVTGFVVVAAGLYLWGVLRVRRRHPARPWPSWRTALFLGGLAVVVIATQSGVGAYDDVLFWDHMIQHLLLLMVAPPMLVLGQPATLLLHASRNPLHTWTKKFLRSRVIAAITWPPLGFVLYAGVIIGTHLTGFMNLVLANEAVHDGEHVLYLAAGYLYFLPLIGREPIRWKVSYPSRIFLLFLAMPVDAFTGLALGSEGGNPFPNMARQRPSWAPSPINDVHIGGAIMWVGGAGIMFALTMIVFFAWSRERRSDGGLGWLEVARRTNFATLVNEHREASPAAGGAPPAVAPVGSAESVDDDEHLAAYNAFLARLNQQHER
jgi:cytochrome c oxidase assembly factor CtaG